MAAVVPTAIAAPTIQPSTATADSKTAPTPPVATTAATIKAPTATPARNVNRPPHFFIGILQTNVSEIFLSSIFSNGSFEAVLITLPSLSTLHISRGVPQVILVQTTFVPCLT